jgi:hypothetical protein
VKIVPPVLAALCLVNISVGLKAQHEDCGTEASEEIVQNFAKTSEDRTAFHANFRSGPVQLPLKVHIVRYSDGSGGLKHNELFDEIQALNRHYAAAGVQFFLCDQPQYIDDDYFADMGGTQRQEITAQYDQNGAINIYFVPRLLASDDKTLCGLSYYFQPHLPEQRDHVFVATYCGSNGSTLAHELGHYLSLLHTHSTTNGTSTVNGSNCGLTGDQICDTPADPMLIGLVNDDCEYVGSVEDPNGDAYDPLTDNIMSYAPASCRSHFTQMQLNRIGYSALVERSYLGCSDTFMLERMPEFTELPIHVSPNPSAGFTRILVDQMPDAGRYLSVAVYNLRGEQLFGTVYDRAFRRNATSVDLGGLEKGIYLVSVTDGNLSASEKLIVQ